MLGSLRAWRGAPRRFLGVTGTLLSLLAAAPVAAKTPVTLWVWPIGADGGRALYDQIIAEFQQMRPDIELRIDIFPWAGRLEKMLLAYVGGNGPDAAYLNLDFFPRFVQEGMLEPLDPYLTRDIRNDYFPRALEAVTLRGRLYGFPILQSLVTYYYNADLFDQSGLDSSQPPRTWSELEAAARKLTRASADAASGQFGLSFWLDKTTTNMTFNPFLWQAGGELFTPDGKQVAFQEAPGREALEFLARLNREGYMARGGATFENGRVAIALARANDYGIQLTKENLPFRWAVGPVLEHRQRVSYGTLAAYAIFNNSRHKQETAEALKYITSPKVMGRLMAAWGYLAPKRSIRPETYGAHKSWIGPFLENAPYTHYDVLHPFVRDVMAILGPEVIAAYNGQKSPQAALEDAARRANALLQENASKL